MENKKNEFKIVYIFVILILIGLFGLFAGVIFAIWFGLSMVIKILMTSSACILFGYFGVHVFNDE